MEMILWWIDLMGSLLKKTSIDVPVYHTQRKLPFKSQKVWRKARNVVSHFRSRLHLAKEKKNHCLLKIYNQGKQLAFIITLTFLKVFSEVSFILAFISFPDFLQ